MQGGGWNVQRSFIKALILNETIFQDRWICHHSIGPSFGGAALASKAEIFTQTPRANPSRQSDPPP
jgi:hypothetical protein